jgi:hypothetical protein
MQIAHPITTNDRTDDRPFIQLSCVFWHSISSAIISRSLQFTRVFVETARNQSQRGANVINGEFSGVGFNNSERARKIDNIQPSRK